MHHLQIASIMPKGVGKIEIRVKKVGKVGQKVEKDGQVIFR